LLQKSFDFGLWIGSKITSAVGTMACALLFAVLALAGLPRALRENSVVDWLIQDFLQLVLMSIILVGQKVQSEKVERQIKETHEASLAEFDIATASRDLSAQQLAELHQMANDISRLLTALEARFPEQVVRLESGELAPRAIADISSQSPEQG